MKEKLTLSGIAKGKLEQLFQRELKNIMNNILDENTSLGRRELVIKILLKPNSEDRRDVSVTIMAESKLAPHEGVNTKLDITRKGLDSFQVTERRSGKDAPGQMYIDPVTGEVSNSPTYVVGSM